MANDKLTIPQTENKTVSGADESPSASISCGALIVEADRVIAAAKALERRKGEAAERAYAIADEQRESLKRLIMLAQPDSLADALGCILALQSDVDHFHELFDLEELPYAAVAALAVRERRWSTALRNVGLALAREGGAVPAAYREFFDLQCASTPA